jgi:HAD superfamily hydrolase (TIGR01509 family)
MDGNKEYKALIFDCDGTLADTMAAHCAAYAHTFNHHNVPFTEEEFHQFAPQGGKTLMKSMVLDKGFEQEIADSIVKMKSECVADFLDTHMKPNEHLIKLIKIMHKQVKIAVVSNGRKKSITTILEKLGIVEYFDLIITSEDYSKPKPNPEPYLIASQKLGVDPSQCYVYEDNEIGYTAAKNAGMDVKMVTIN